MRIQNTLIRLIDNYQNEKLSNFDYLKKQFEHLMDKARECKKIYLAREEFNFLSKDLQSRLLSIDKQDQIILSDFLKTFLDVSRIKIVTIYRWNVGEDQLKKLEKGDKISSKRFIYKFSKKKTFNFQLHLRLRHQDKKVYPSVLFENGAESDLTKVGIQLSQNGDGFCGGCNKINLNDGYRIVGFDHSQIKAKEIVFKCFLDRMKECW